MNEKLREREPRIVREGDPRAELADRSGSRQEANRGGGLPSRSQSFVVTNREEWEALNDEWRRRADLRYAQELLRWSRSLG